MRRWLLLLVLTTCATPPPPPPPPKRDMKEEIRRHGEWILVPPWGKLWHPNQTQTGQHFAPYATGGRWVRGPKGWVFEGPWEWSEVVFQYGRWLWTQDYDWLWAFDEIDGTAFVDWRIGSEFVGWSPIPPVPPKLGMQPPERRWFYVKARYFAQEEIARYVLTGEEATRASELTEALPQSATFSGPPPEFLVKNSGLVDTGDGGYRVPEIAAPPPTPEPPAVQEAPKSNVEVEVTKQPERPKKTKPKKGKKK